jgi:formate dehydrogenase subunit beta
MIQRIRTQVAERLKELDGVIGLRQTTQGTAPYLFQPGDDLEQLVLEPRYPLSETLSKLHKRFPEANFGIVARGCDSRALIEMAKRNQVDPDRLYLIGISCSVEQAVSCYCAEPAPNLDQWPRSELIGEPVPAAPPNPMVAEYENISLGTRRKFWKLQFSKCIKCFGCRDICPVCFCDACALENPLWVEPGVLVPDFPMYHLIKAMHMTTRCVACRQCEMACPADIPLTVLYDLIRRDVADLMGYIPGADIDSNPPLSLTLADAPIESDLVN